MPIYQYECQACGRIFEKRQSMSDDPLSICADCGGALRKIISGGSGFFMQNGGKTNTGKTGGACSLERTGRTCCGSSVRCDTPGCGSGK